MKKRERKYIGKKKTKALVFVDCAISIPFDQYRTLNFLDNHPCNQKK